MMAMSSHPCTVTPSAQFIYHPPDAALTARQILIKPNLGYPVPHPVTVSVPVLAEVLRSLRYHNPKADIFIVEGVCSPKSLHDITGRLGIHPLLDDHIHLIDADTLPLHSYPNRFPNPVRFASMWAPALLQEVDCRISIAPLKQTLLHQTPLMSASLKNLYGLFPRAKYKARSPHSRGQLHRPSVPLVLQDVFGCIGHLFDGAVVDASLFYNSPDWKPDRSIAGIPLNSVVFGSSLLEVDATAASLADLEPPDYVLALKTRLPEML
jgi:hypothetical protein